MPGIRKSLVFRKSFVNRKFIKMSTWLIFISTPKCLALSPYESIVGINILNNGRWKLYCYSMPENVDVIWSYMNMKPDLYKNRQIEFHLNVIVHKITVHSKIYHPTRTHDSDSEPTILLSHSKLPRAQRIRSRYSSDLTCLVNCLHCQNSKCIKS